MTRSEAHHHHRDVSGGWLRAGVFGAMDGLVTNGSLIAGFSGGSASRHGIVLAGFVLLVGGAFSMGVGEYTSVRSQNEATANEVDVERRELVRVPQAEQRELAGVFRSRGVEAALADEVARQLSADPEVALRVHSQEELGVDPDHLPSPFVAAGSSFAAFVAGAFVPLLPYLLGATSLVFALVLAGAALFAAGVFVSRLTGRSALYSGIRQLILGALATGVTYWVGTMIGQ